MCIITMDRACQALEQSRASHVQTRKNATTNQVAPGTLYVQLM